MFTIPSVKVKTHKYDFDTVIDRTVVRTVKIDGLDRTFGRHDIMPMWVADLDFAVCPEISEALKKRAGHPIYGYYEPSDSYWNSIIGWLRRRHNFEVERNELTFIPGVVKGLGLYVNFFTKPGDGVVIQPPIYHPFRFVVEGNDRRVIENPLRLEDGVYSMDLEGLREIAEREHPRMLLLCNPHNPIGIQWSRETMAEVARIARENNMIVVADEIHSDLMLDGRKHIPFLACGDDAVAVGAMLGAPSKTFNIPGLVSSWTVIKNPALREPFFRWLSTNEFSDPPEFSATGAEMAYTYGWDWLGEMLSYVQANIDFVEDYCRREMPEVGVFRPEASFLVWLDFRKLGLKQPELMELLLGTAHIAMNDGTMFGRQGEGFTRLNVGCPRSVLAEALDRIRDAVKHKVPVC